MTIKGSISMGGETLSEVWATSPRSFADMLFAELLACHARHGHEGLKVDVDSLPDSARMVDLHVECIAPKCGRRHVEYRNTVPDYMVGAVTLMVHTAHEGHPMRITFDGQTVESPR